jgi:hypothetical protein
MLSAPYALRQINIGQQYCSSFSLRLRRFTLSGTCAYFIHYATKSISMKVSVNIFLLFLFLTGCQHNTTTTASSHTGDYLLWSDDTINGGYCYKNTAGEIIIPSGKYFHSYTDTFRTYALVLNSDSDRWVAIDRNDKIMYNVFPFDNGPDYYSDGTFRMTENNKIGFVDSATGKIIIKPQFDCAWPFRHGVAQVSLDCSTEGKDEFRTWVSKHWHYIDKTGKEVEKPKWADE